ncbi:Metalloenzyme, LuxS/M16 peptidase-like protein [Pseudomassariella vexata]|uniref:Cytochrome b-c1 complex subunit 2, mitochondrial n=1 Tax=Pseudomassariella vexata TaxID=1141098 RepID=A0A1Y2DXN5_9PEZI|nr:Metalloenzyme, LuxS/M16 peptidase-like protein [Pseudomassariella vexata]ORY63959.1 Metalloenzyme, LuxS/M16 peptidase-like protein [Pseudomassariella vexata]
MFSRTALVRGAQLATRRQASCKLAQRRGYAAAASSAPATFNYETSDVAGVKIASRDSHGPTTKLAIVAKAGTRYEPAPGLTVGLEEFAYKNTTRRSALRIVRESELLGGRLNAYHTREALVLEASFFREDLPYFTELLAEVISQTKYTTYEYHEEVERVMHVKQPKHDNDPSVLALDAAHAVAFHTGLGAPSYPTATTVLKGYTDENSIAAYAESVYAKSNIALVADGASSATLSKWTEQFFKSVPASSAGSLSLNAKSSNYYGGEQRLAHTAGNSLVIAFPGSSFGTFKPEVTVLAALLGGQSNVKWSPGFTLLAKAAASSPGATASATNLAYSDAGLLTIQVSGGATAVRGAAQEAVKALKSIAEGSVSKEDLTKAIAKAKFDALSSSESGVSTILSAGSGLVHTGKPFQIAETTKSLDGVTAEKLKTAAKSLLDGKASVAAVGDLFALPYAEELGLKV